MSDMEAHKGKLHPMALIGDTLEERAEAACRQLDIEPTGAHETWLEALKDRGYRKVYILNSVIYLIYDEELDASGYSFASSGDGGSIDYQMLYYNGGASFDEVLDEAIERANINEHRNKETL